MLIKPLISKYNPQTSKSNSLPFVSKINSKTSSIFPYRDREESIEYLETYGRLLTLTIQYREKNLKFEKRNHEENEFLQAFRFHRHWSLCNCDYAKRIRCQDLLIEDYERYLILKEVI